MELVETLVESENVGGMPPDAFEGVLLGRELGRKSPFFLTGALVGSYNIWMTIRAVGREAKVRDVPTDSEAGEPAVPVAE